MMKGELKQIGSISDVFNKPQNKSIAKFTGAENIIQGKVISHKHNNLVINVFGQTIIAFSLYTHKKIELVIRPEDISLLPYSFNETEKTIHSNLIKGTIIDITYLGSIYRVKLDIGISVFITKKKCR